MDRGPAWDRVTVDIPGFAFEPKPPRSRTLRSDSECDGWSTGAITLRSASLRGYQHRYYGLPRQDAVCATVHAGMGAVIFAVADGVSGADASEIGAAEACYTAASAIAWQFDHGTATLDCARIARRVAARLRWRAGQILGIPDPDTERASRILATTLVTGAAWPRDGGLTVQLFRIGDSAAWVLDPDRERYSPVFGASPALPGLALVPTEVTALPEVPQTLEQTAVTVGPGQVLLVGTDGFGVPLGDGDGEIGELFARTLASVPSPFWLAHVLDFSRETFDDDRTLLALWPARE